MYHSRRIGSSGSAPVRVESREAVRSASPCPRGPADAERTCHVHLSTVEALSQFAQEAIRTGLLAIDTEFLSGKTYYAKLCLIQLAAGGQAAYVDPLALKDLSPLIDILLDGSILKIMHAASQDMALLSRLCGRPPKPVFDTQVAATLAGHASQTGYGKLVAALTGVTLEKSESFTDWSRRPLTDKQVQYALDDVIYLEPMYLALTRELEASGRLGWLTDDFEALSNPETYETPLQELYRSIKHATRLNGRQLAILREVAAWRETEAQRRNLPRQWVLKDEVLIELARRKPATPEALGELRDLNPRSLGDHGRDLLAAISAGLAVPNSELPRLSHRPAPDSNQEGVVKLMGALVRLRAETHGIAVPLLASQSDLEAMASGDVKDNPLMHGWRREMIGQELLRLLDGKLSMSVKNGAVIVTEQG